MFEWSKDIVRKIEESGCVSKHELRSIEVALRLYDVYNRALDECLNLEEESFLELEHRIK